MKTLIAIIGCLSLGCLAGCTARPTAETDILNARLLSEKNHSTELAERVNHAETAKAAAEKQLAEGTAKLGTTTKQLADARDNLAMLRQQLNDAQQAKTAAEEKARKALADNEVLKGRLSPRGTLRTIDDNQPPNAVVPKEIQVAFRTALAWRANQIRSLEIEIRDTPSKADERALRAMLEKLRASPLAPAPLVPTDLTLGQIGPLEINDHLRVESVVDDKTVVLTPVKLDARLTPEAAPQVPAVSAAPRGSDYVREDANPIAIHGLSTKGVVTGAKITSLPGLYYVEKTQRYGSRTIFVLAPVDANKVRTYFNQLQSEMRAEAMAKTHGGNQAAK